ncbi:MAG TPA: DUF1579 domain-containing protein [Flavobacteriaceae bacterium]|nr:DUF1579 domain-containing protein [Flavobacteriaceae bacterium]
MKKIMIGFTVLAFCFTSCNDNPNGPNEAEDATVVADSISTDTLDAEKELMEEPMDSLEMQKAWEAYMTPGEVHKELAKEVGSWNNEMTFWMEPNGEPTKATSTADIEMIMDGRYQLIKYHGNVMGMPFEGRATVAYDNKTEEIISTWIDNMGTGMLVMRGKADDSGKVITTTGSMVDPFTGNEIAVREVYTIVDENTRKMEMFHASKNGEEYKAMEIVMTRK